ncbi:MAG TPA: lipoyl synthase, partial [Anaerolineae bacterium]|nr:lipoyl synthase [Anaerolineae bacterium]
RLQRAVAQARRDGTIGDTLLLVEHPPVITIGRGGGEEDVLVSPTLLRQAGVSLCHTDRGGRATYHGPGQLVAYPILKPSDSDLYRHVWQLEEIAILLLASYGLRAGRRAEYPGVWIDGRKVASVGVAVQDGVTRHGMALNLAPRMEHFDLLISCGVAGAGATSVERETGRAPDRADAIQRFLEKFGTVFACEMMVSPPGVERFSAEVEVHPTWLWQRVSAQAEAAVASVEELMAGKSLHTVCQEAHCPNIGECFSAGRATFMILGDKCTRACRFCAVHQARPAPPDAGEPARVTDVAAGLGLNHVVITSVTRDDLPDGGAGQFARTISALRQRLPGATIEVLIPDFGGRHAALEQVLEARPHVVNHNLETVPRLYDRVRPHADYHRSLAVLARAKALAPGVVTKSGLMVGLGERVAEVSEVMRDLGQVRCDLLTIGQYLQATERQVPVARYVPPGEFAWHEARARSFGFRGVAAGPLVRSSYRAEGLYQDTFRSVHNGDAVRNRTKW